MYCTLLDLSRHISENSFVRFFYFSTKEGCNPVLRVLDLQGFEPRSNHNLIIGHVNLFNDKGEI